LLISTRLLFKSSSYFVKYQYSKPCEGICFE